MSDFIVLSCTCCGGQPRVTPDADRFACRHCGREHLVRRQAGQTDLVPVVKHLDRISRGMDGHASELAIRRLKEDRRVLRAKVEDGRRELWASASDCRSAHRRMVTAFVPAGASLFAAAFLFVIRDFPACFGFFAILIAGVSALVGAYKYSRLGGLDRHLSAARRRLHQLRDRLDEREDELDYHLEAVRVR
jgi:hypothetical protein